MRIGAAACVLSGIILCGCGGGGGDAQGGDESPPPQDPGSATEPAAPSGLAATSVQADVVQLAWTDASDDETGFVLERRAGAAAFEVIAQLAANATAYSDGNVSPDSDYAYRVRARNDAGDSAPSNTLEVHTPAPPPAGGTPTLSVSTNAIEFNATNLVSTPGRFFLTGSISGEGSGTLYVLVEVDGGAVAQVSGFDVDEASASITGAVWPRWPGDLGVGEHHGTITIRACVNDSSCATGELAGSPQLVNVTYTVTTSVQGQIVAPRVVPAGASGLVVLRSEGLGAANQVTIGGADATVASQTDTELRAAHAALTTGSHPIVLDGGAVSFTPSLLAVDDAVFAAEELPYPSPPAEIGNVLYDAGRQRLLVVVRYDDPAANELLRYSYQGGSWLAPTRTSIPSLRDIAFSPDGAVLLAVTDTELQELDAETLAMQTSGSPDSEPFTLGHEHLNRIVVANDGYAIVTSQYNGSGSTWPHLYSTQSREFSMFFDTTRDPMDDVKLAASGDGSRVLLMPNTVRHYDYWATPQTLQRIDLQFRHSGITMPAVNADGTRLFLIGSDWDGVSSPEPPVARIYDANYQVLGTLPATPPATTRAAVFSPDSSRVYTFDESNDLRTFDLAADVNGGPYPEAAPPVNLGVVSSVHDFAHTIVYMRISPDGRTLFIGGNEALLVQPAP